MTEQIKSTIEELESRISPYNSCQADYLANEAIKISIRSLKAWEEVLTELEEVKEDVMELNIEYYLGELAGLKKAINIINQHLAEIEE